LDCSLTINQLFIWLRILCFMVDANPLN